ncbi:MAG TPA: ATP-binding protein [Bacteroidales bacterium]|nr:ATP-binding protein [Bacteroidales bacterium]
MVLTDNVKKEIVDKLIAYCDRYESQNKAANTLKGVSSATISQMINGKWKLIAENMWRNVASQIGWREHEWNSAVTSNLRELNSFYTTAQEQSMVLAITAEAGTGKTWGAREYCSNNRSAYLIQCNEFWSKKTFLAELSRVVGIDNRDLTMGEMMQDIVWQLKSDNKPIIILDEADKLSDGILYFFITLYNYLEDQCALVLQATDYLEQRMKSGLRKNAKGFPEIWSRVGRKCIKLDGVSADDIRNICLANGLTDERDIEVVVNDSEGDFRRVKRKIQAIRNKRQAVSSKQ